MTLDPAATVRRTSPAVVAALVVLFAVAVIGVRTVSVCEGAIGCPLVAGDNYSDAAQVDIPVTEGDGYDAQFFYRQVRSPFDFSMQRANGVVFDTEVRYGRIGFPLVAWVLSAGGQPAAVPWAMLGVGVLSLGAVAWVLALGARDARRSPWWGALAVALPGVWFAAGRGLADPLSTALVGAAALALTRRRYGLATAAFAVAALTKEQAVLVPAVYGLWRLWELLVIRRRARAVHAADDAPGSDAAAPGFGVADLPWLVPGAVFVVWQLVLWSVTGAMPAGEAGGSHVVAPLSDLLPAVIDWVTPSGTSQVLWLLEVAVFVALAALVAVSDRSAGWERGVAIVGVLFVAVLNDNVFVDPAHFRQLGEVSVVLCLAAFRADPRWWVPILGANGVATVGVLGRLAAAL
ncbi:MAG: hypothetical protein M3Y51_11665 [Actinomycetota bacterium]|nr:hypothetical protein [Actinomycetota bacterium]